MTRKEAIKILKSKMDGHTDTSYEWAETVRMAIKALEQEPKWIPVSKKLPKENKWYLCTVDLSDFLYVTMDLYFKNGKWLDNRRIDMFNCYEIYGFGKSTEKHRLDYSELLEDFDWTERVIAWMPLPKPFEQQESEKKG